MTSLLDAPVADEVVLPDAAPPHDAAPVASVLRTSLSTYLAMAAAGWMLSGVFSVGPARAIGLLGPAVGVAIVAGSYRSRRPATVQHLAVPAALVLGALAVVPYTHKGSANLPHLVLEAIRGGGISQPPVPFDPGWRFILIVVTVLAGSAATALSVGLGRPRLGALAGMAVVLAGALVQPASSEVVSVVVALILLVASLGVSFGAELSADGRGSGAFELRRLGRGAAVVVLLLAGLVALSRFGFLFPASHAHEVIPPKRPETPPVEADRVLFTVQADRQVTWRLGVLDGYDGRAFLTPPYDTSRFIDVGRGAITKAPAGPTIKATFTVADERGHVVPGLASPTSVSAAGVRLAYDPRTQQLRLPSRQASRGMRYTVVASAPPTAQELSAAPVPPATVKEFLRVPPAPAAVVDLLAAAPTSPLFARLQYVRNVFYAHVVAAGAGNPVEVPPARVAAMLGGKEASPYEITAGEVLLARWAGVPARIGYGYFGGDRVADGQVAIRPRHGATWLEVYFEGHGWVPIVGTPPRAKSSLDHDARRNDPTVRPTDELALLVYVPVRLRTVQLLYTLVRYWIARVVAGGLAIGGVVYLMPGVLKSIRRIRRRRAARRRGSPARLATAYAEFRDAAADFAIGAAHLTPLEFVAVVDDDAEHAQLAWLVTRGLWGDLARALDDDDAAAGEEMATSVTRRLRRAQPLLNRLSAFGSRASLRAPWADGIPNLWPRSARVARRPLRIAAGVAALALVAGGVAVTRSGLRSQRPEASGSSPALPTRLAPDRIEDVGLQREPTAEAGYRQAGTRSAIAEGRVLSIRQGEDIQGSLQVATFAGGLNAGDEDVRRGVLRSIGRGQFVLTRIGQARVYALDLPEQRFLLWFAPSGRYFELMVTRSSFAQSDGLFVTLLDYQRGAAAESIRGRAGVPVPDPRRGVPE